MEADAEPSAVSRSTEIVSSANKAIPLARVWRYKLLRDCKWLLELLRSAEAVTSPLEQMKLVIGLFHRVDTNSNPEYCGNLQSVPVITAFLLDYVYREMESAFPVDRWLASPLAMLLSSTRQMSRREALRRD